MNDNMDRPVVLLFVIVGIGLISGEEFIIPDVEFIDETRESTKLPRINVYNERNDQDILTAEVTSSGSTKLMTNTTHNSNISGSEGILPTSTVQPPIIETESTTELKTSTDQDLGPATSEISTKSETNDSSTIILPSKSTDKNLLTNSVEHIDTTSSKAMGINSTISTTATPPPGTTSNINGNVVSSTVMSTVPSTVSSVTEYIITNSEYIENSSSDATLTTIGNTTFKPFLTTSPSVITSNSTISWRSTNSENIKSSSFAASLGTTSSIDQSSVSTLTLTETTPRNSESSINLPTDETSYKTKGDITTRSDDEILSSTGKMLYSTEGTASTDAEGGENLSTNDDQTSTTVDVTIQPHEIPSTAQTSSSYFSMSWTVDVELSSIAVTDKDATSKSENARTLKMAISITFLCIALVAVAVLIVYVLRVKTHRIRYDEITLLP